MPLIRSFLDLSTGHLRPSTREWLDGLDWGPEGGSPPGGRTTYGWFIWADQDGVESPEEHAAAYEIPLELVRCMVHARKHGCDYMLFDADAPIDPDLVYYGDGEEPEQEAA